MPADHAATARRSNASRLAAQGPQGDPAAASDLYDHATPSEPMPEGGANAPGASPSPPTVDATRPVPADPVDSSLPTVDSSLPTEVDAWLTELGLEPAGRATRDGIASWDLVLDGRRRRDLAVTLIHDPGLGLVVWAHYAPPISDGFRKAYRRLLRWNDDFPFAKFGVTEDERPVLAVELPADRASADELGLALARIAGIADRLFDESADWLDPGGREAKAREARAARAARDGLPPPPEPPTTRRNEALLTRFEARLPELFAPEAEPE